MQMLKTAKEFDFVYKNSYKFRSEMLDICVLKPSLAGDFCAKFGRISCNMVGFSVSKKVGIAVERNLIKRRLRAICREFFVRNSSLGSHCVDLQNFECSQTSSLVSHSKFCKNSTSTTANTRIVLNANISKNLPLPCGGGQKGWVNSVQQGNCTNLICIFIAKKQILQVPFSALKENIFATLKRQMSFMKRNAISSKNTRDFARGAPDSTLMRTKINKAKYD